MEKLILATSNPGKIAELQALLTSFHCIPQTSLGIPDAKETGTTFIENALIKARHASLLGNKPALADDSGLVVPALNGEPGIYSSRYAHENASDVDNIDLLLARMQNIPDEQRTAYFYCVIVLMRHSNDPTPLIATGRLTGNIGHTPIGRGGFGYDPIFYLTQYHCTIACLDGKIKNEISHRALALKQLSQQLCQSLTR